MEFLRMPKELNDLSVWMLNGLSDWVLSHWFPTEKSSHAGAGRKIGQWKRAWEGHDSAKWRCDLAQSGGRDKVYIGDDGWEVRSYAIIPSQETSCFHGPNLINFKQAGIPKLEGNLQASKWRRRCQINLKFQTTHLILSCCN